MKRADYDKLSKALNRFMREDPTFRVHVDKETNETIISGMGELHLEIYVERIRREYKVECTVGAPKVSYRECSTCETPFNYKHKKQTGGSGQYAHVVGKLIPLDPQSPEPFVFEREGHLVAEFPLSTYRRSRRASGNRCIRGRSLVTKSSACICDLRTARITTWIRRRWPSRFGAIVSARPSRNRSQFFWSRL